MALSPATLIGRVFGRPKPLVNQMVANTVSPPAPLAPRLLPGGWGSAPSPQLAGPDPRLAGLMPMGGNTTKFGAFALGGTIQPNQVGLVGEQGPELVLGQTPATILPAGQTAQMMSYRNDLANALKQQMAGGFATMPGTGFSGAPMAPQSPSGASYGSGLAQQLMGQIQMGGNRSPGGAAMGNAQTLDQRFAAAGGVLPAGLVDRPSQEAYMKQNLLMQGGQRTGAQNAMVATAQANALQKNMASPYYNGPDQAGIDALRQGGQPLGSEQIAGMRRQAGQPGSGVPGQGVPGVQLPFGGGLGGQPGQGGLPGAPGQGGQPGGQPMSQLQQLLMQQAQGQNAVQIAPGQVPEFAPELMNAIRGQLSGEGSPTFQDIVEGTFNPMSALMDQQFNTAKTQMFEDLISRGVLQSGEAVNTLTRMAAELGMNKGALLGQLALDYSKERNQQIQAAISQYSVLEGQRASMQTTINVANLQAASQIQATAMQTLVSLNTAMAQIGSAEKIAGADIASREKVAGMNIASGERIAGMDIASRQAIAQMQAETQQSIANISAQAMLQAANFDVQRAHQQLTATMALEGVDWNRFQSDPTYAANVVDAFAIERDAHLAIDQAAAVTNTLPPMA